jgi:5-methylcytosine-specific restriction endonuclease McrA
MPIKPENLARYPKDWKQIRGRILERAKHACEGSPLDPDCRVLNGSLHPVTGSKVVLTIAHLDHTPENCADDNLRAWCQRCHLAYDHDHHQRNAYQTRRAGKAVDMFEQPA